MTFLVGPWWRANRFVLSWLGIATLLTASAGLVVAGQLQSVASTLGCAIPSQAGIDDAGCLAVPAFRDLYAPATAMGLLLAILPIFAGAVLGSQMVAREIDEGTARFAWTLEPSRLRWFVEGIIRNGLFVLMVGSVCGVVGYALVATENPPADPGGTFLGYGLWGPILVVRGFLGFGIGVLCGGGMGRTLPALLITLIVSAALVVSALVAARTFYPTEIRMFGHGDSPAEALIIAGGMNLAPDGRLIMPMEALSHAPPGLAESDPNAASAWVDLHYPPASTVIVGSNMADVQVHEGVVLLAASALSLTAAALLVSRRRLA